MKPNEKKSGIDMGEVYSKIERAVDNCSYVDKRTIEAAIGAVIDWGLERDMDHDALREMFDRRLAQKPYPPRVKE